MRLLIVLLLIAGCSNPPAPPTTAAAPAPATASAAEGANTPRGAGPRVIFPDGFVVSVEVAADDDRRAEGLMYRDRLHPATGMLFLFPSEAPISFWMKNTRIPLDMIFLDSNRRIVGIERDVPPCRFDPCPSYGPEAMSRYVLEVAGGVAAQHGLKPGDVLRFEGTEGIPIR